MTAARLRRVGNTGHQVDPGDVVAVHLVANPSSVAVLMSSGMLLRVLDLDDGAAATLEDVDRVVRQLTYKGPA